MACQAYKEKFGEYPPDFAGVDGSLGTAQKTKAIAAVARHLAKAFPRYTGDWTDPSNGLAAMFPIGITLTPQTALAIWLGGIPDGNGNPSGFAADPTNPFQPASVCASRVGPFFDFDRARINNGRFFSKGASASQMTSGAGAITYFRAENGTYCVDNTTTTKSVADTGSVNVCPAWNVNASTWVNPTAVQIFSPGLDMAYSSPTGSVTDRLNFPTGDNYGVNTFDDITNFSGGKTLEDNKP
jgi:hypothetical protein